jgi:hypothetical protein
LMIQEHFQHNINKLVNDWLQFQLEQTSYPLIYFTIMRFILVEYCTWSRRQSKSFVNIVRISFDLEEENIFRKSDINQIFDNQSGIVFWSIKKSLNILLDQSIQVLMIFKSPNAYFIVLLRVWMSDRCITHAHPLFCLKNYDENVDRN